MTTDAFHQDLIPVGENGQSLTQQPAGSAPQSASEAQFHSDLIPVADPNAKPYDPGELRSIAPYGATDALVHGLTLGVSDPLRAAKTAAVRYLFGDTPDFDYAKAQQEIARGREFYAASSPWASAASNFAGNLAFPGSLAARGVNAVASPLAKISVSGLLGGGMGAVQGAADRGDTLQNAVQGAVSGGETGAAVGAALPTAATLIPGMTPAAQTLRAVGVEPPPGAARGGIPGMFEDLLSKVPLVGLPIQYGRSASQDQLAGVIARNRQAFPTNAVNHALEPIGESLAPDTAGGSAQVEEMMRKASQAYQTAVPEAGAQLDPTATAALNDIRAELSLNSPDRLSQYDAFLAAKVHSRVGDDGTLPGDAFKRAESDLGKQAHSLLGPRNDSDQQALGQAYRDAQTVLRENLARNSGDSADAIAAANETWKRALPVRHAAGGDLLTGDFSPTQLASSARTVAGRNRYATGQAPMQDFARNAMQDEQTLANAGTAVLKGTNLGVGGAVGTGMLTASLLEHLYQDPSIRRMVALGVPASVLTAAYSNPGRMVINQGLTGARGLLDTATPYAPAAGGFASGLLNYDAGR